MNYSTYLININM